MTWRDNLRPASFRGVEFHFEDVGRQFGRRVKTHEYPGGEEPYHEDLGAMTTSIDITAYVLEPDHIAKAQRLEAALMEAGPGTLVHPYYGEISVVSLSVNERFTTREGGMARFTIRFERAGPNRNPAARIDTPSLLEERAASIDTAAQSEFATVFTVDGAPGWVADSAETDLGTMADDVNATVTGALDTAATAAEFASSIGNIKANASTLVRSPATLASRISQAVAMTPGVSAPLKLAATTAGLGSIAATTPSRLLQANNRQAIVDLVNGVSLAAAVRNLPAETFATSADAYGVRDAIGAEVDRQSLSAGDGTLRALSKGLAAVTRHVAAVAPSLPRLVTVRPTMTRPSLVHAYGLYGDDLSTVLSRAGEIETRNRLRHPGFVPALDPLEVLGNA